RRGAAVEQSSDVRMFQARHDLAFHAKMARHALGIEARLEKFDGDFFMERLVRAESAVDGAHATLADILDDLVRADARAWSQGTDVYRQRTFEEVAGLFMCFDQRFHLLFKFLVVLADLVQKGLALFTMQPQRIVEDLFDELPALSLHIWNAG